MPEFQQLSLFPTQPRSPADLFAHTPLRDTVAVFQAHLVKEGKSDHTVAAFTADLALLAEWCGDDKPIGKFSTTLLNDFLRWMEYDRGVPCSRKTYARRVTTLKTYFKWLKRHGAIPHDPADAILQRSGPAPLAEILSAAEVDAVLRHAERLRRGVGDSKPDARPALLFSLLLHTGIKKSETMRLTPADLDRTDPNAPVLLIKHETAKDIYKERRLALPADWPHLLDEYRAQERRTTRRTKLSPAIFNCTARNLEYVLEDLGMGAGIDPKISFEMMRWTSAVRDYMAGADPDAIRERLGLSKISWVETYAKIKLLTEKQYGANV